MHDTRLADVHHCIHGFHTTGAQYAAAQNVDLMLVLENLGLQLLGSSHQLLTMIRLLQSFVEIYDSYLKQPAANTFVLLVPS